VVQEHKADLEIAAQASFKTLMAVLDEACLGEIEWFEGPGKALPQRYPAQSTTHNTSKIDRFVDSVVRLSRLWKYRDARRSQKRTGGGRIAEVVETPACGFIRVLL
jgi:hypothetical protein